LRSSRQALLFPYADALDVSCLVAAASRLTELGAAAEAGLGLRSAGAPPWGKGLRGSQCVAEPGHASLQCLDRREVPC
jgi:hypothetical protein